MAQEPLPKNLQIYDLQVERYDEVSGAMGLVMRRFVTLDDYEKLWKQYHPAERKPGDEKPPKEKDKGGEVPPSQTTQPFKR